MSSFCDLEGAKARNSLVQHVVVGSADTPSVFKKLLDKRNNVYACCGTLRRVLWFSGVDVSQKLFVWCVVELLSC